MARADRDRWLALALLLAVLGLLYLLLLHPWVQAMGAADTRIAGLLERDARARGLLAQKPEIERRLAALAAAGGDSSFLPEASAELATAGLIQKLETVVGEASPENAGCIVANRAPLTGEPPPGRYRRITVQVRLRCGNAETLAVLHALESARPWLFIDNLNINAQRNAAMPGRGARPLEGGVDVSFDLFGYLRPQPQAEANHGG